jgi:hypothetical protein
VADSYGHTAAGQRWRRVVTHARDACGCTGFGGGTHRAVPAGHPNRRMKMKKDKNVSKRAAAMMKDLKKEELDRAAGGYVIRIDPCLTCGLLHTPGI